MIAMQLLGGMQTQNNPPPQKQQADVLGILGNVLQNNIGGNQ